MGHLRTLHIRGCRVPAGFRENPALPRRPFRSGAQGESNIKRHFAGRRAAVVCDACVTFGGLPLASSDVERKRQALGLPKRDVLDRAVALIEAWSTLGTAEGNVFRHRADRAR